MKAQPYGFLPNSAEGDSKTINSELWHACAGPLVSLPPVGSLVVYFPQGHSEQVAASMQKENDFIPGYPNLPSKLICMLHNVTLHADPETDEVYAQMTLQPVNKYDKVALLASEMALKQNKQPIEFFCKTLTASDTSTHGGFFVPRRAAEKIFPPLDFSMQPPAQELVAKDLHDTTWTFRHIYRGQPKRHLLTTGWSVFVSSKRLLAGDSVLFIRDEKSQLLSGIRHSNRHHQAFSSSVISSDSMHMGILAAAAHAAANNSLFTIFYNPRASPSEFVVPLAKYGKAMYSQVSLGMRFRMMFETEESGVRRFMGTISGISDLDPVRWKNSQWRNLQVGWDESTASERRSRVSIWEIEPVVTPFYICPPPVFRPKFPRQPEMPDDELDIQNAFKQALPWLGDDFGTKDATSSIFTGLSSVQCMSMQQNNQFPAAQLGLFPSMVSSTDLHNNFSTDDPSKLNFQPSALSAPYLQSNKANPQNQFNQLTQPRIASSQQQQLLQLLHTRINQQQPHQQLLLPQQPQQQQQQNHHHIEQPQQLQLQPQPSPNLPQSQPPVPRGQQKQQQQQIFLPAYVNNGALVSNPNQHVQQPAVYSQLQQQQLLTNNTQSPRSIHSTNKSPYQLTSFLQDSQFQHQAEQLPGLLERHQQQTQLQQSCLQFLQQGFAQRTQQQPQVQQLPQQCVSEQQLQFQLQQKFQQQQLLSPTGLLLQPPLLQQQLVHQQNQQLSQLPPGDHQKQLSNSSAASVLVQPQHLPMDQPLRENKPLTGISTHSSFTGGDAPSSSTSPSTNNCQVHPSNFLNRNQQGPAFLVEDSVVESASNLVQELHSESGIRIKHEFPNSKGLEHLKYKGTVTGQLEALSSGTSYCLDPGNMQQNFSIPNYGFDGDAQSHPQTNLPCAADINRMAPDTLLAQGFNSQKDLQNLLCNYGGTPRDIETELSSAAISLQSFGVPNMPLKPAVSNEVPINEAGVLSSGMLANQTQCMRTYTKVQKRGSVGRTIDVTHYKGYDELRHDLARMFGVEGQLEDPLSANWKLVYVDHENDILLVGDDPWVEFVSCVQRMKILSSAEVQQMSVDGDLGNVAVPNQACSGTDSGNAWRHYDDNSPSHLINKSFI